MRELQLYQEQIAEAVARALGDDPRQPRRFGGQMRLIGHEAAILALPDTPASGTPMIVTDPTSPFFGRERFLAGVSRLDGPDVVA